MKDIQIEDSNFKRYVPVISGDQFWEIKIYIPKFESLLNRRVQFKDNQIQGTDANDIILKY
jgi:hypothetical protein